MQQYAQLFSIFVFLFCALFPISPKEKNLSSKKPLSLNEAIEKSTSKYWLADIRSKNLLFYLDKRGFGEYGWRIKIQPYSGGHVQEYFALSNGDDNFHKNKWSADFYPRSNDARKKVDKNAGMVFSMELISPHAAIATFKPKDNNTTSNKTDYGKIRLSAS